MLHCNKMHRDIYNWLNFPRTSMRTPHSSPRFFNPLMLWTDVALKTGEMLVSSSSVIQMRTCRMAEHGLQPNAADMREMRLMSQEKIAAANESSAAVAKQLQITQGGLMKGAQQWLDSASALMALATSATPAQAVRRGEAFITATTRAAATATQLSSAGARMAQRSLKPIHAKATSNARRLSATRA